MTPTTEAAVLRTVCAWCPPDVPPMDGQGPIPPGTVISHGMCQTHKDQFLREVA